MLPSAASAVALPAELLLLVRVLPAAVAAVV
jgi:hypothetical protein